MGIFKLALALGAMAQTAAETADIEDQCDEIAVLTPQEAACCGGYACGADAFGVDAGADLDAGLDFETDV